jgi:hypothetical protein
MGDGIPQSVIRGLEGGRPRPPVYWYSDGGKDIGETAKRRIGVMRG